MSQRALAVALLASLALFGQTAPLPDWVSVEADIPYDTQKETVLDVLKPKQAAAGKRPGVLLIHGGGWTGGSKEAVVRNFGLRWLEKGFVVANVEYRLAKVALAPAAVSDVLKAADWFRRNAAKYGVDDKKIIVSGDSAGGHLSLMVGLTPKQAGFGTAAKVAGVVNFYGITDVGDLLEGPNEKKYATTWIPDSMADRRELARRVSPQTWVRKGEPPVLTIHGDADPTVPYDHGVTLTKMLRDAGNDAELVSVAGGQHGDFLRDAKKADGIWQQIWEWAAKRKLLPGS